MLPPPGSPAFEALEELKLQQCSELKVLPRHLAAMKALRRLELSSCGLRSIAALPASCSGLTALVVEGMVEVGAWAGLARALLPGLCAMLCLL
jgi:hypothetical protein